MWGIMLDEPYRLYNECRPIGLTNLSVLHRVAVKMGDCEFAFEPVAFVMRCALMGLGAAGHRPARCHCNLVFKK